MRREEKVFSSHESRTKPFVARKPTPRPTTSSGDTPPTLPPPPLIRTHKPAPSPAAELPPAARAYAADGINPNSHRHSQWDTAKRTELAVFDAIDCKNTIHISEVPARTQIFNYTWRVTHKANRGNGKPDERARFCIAGNEDRIKDINVPTSPVTPQRAIQALVAAAAVMDLPIHTEDFLRAYLRQTSSTRPSTCASRLRQASQRATSGHSTAPDGKDDAGRHLHCDTQGRFLKIPGIILSAVFDTIYIIPKQGALATYVDDSLSIGNKRFMDAIETVRAQYKTHRVDRGAVQFADITATTDNNGIHCSAGAYADTVNPVDVPARANDTLPSGKALHSLAAKLLWVGRCGRPDILTNATHLANMKEPTGTDAKRANDILAILHHRPMTLTFPKLDRDSLRVAVYADYSGSTESAFAKNQVGYIIVLTDSTHRFAPLHWASHRPSRVCRGTTTGELLALADAVAGALDIRQLLEELMDQQNPPRRLHGLSYAVQHRHIFPGPR